MVGITTQPYPLLWTACVLPQVGLLACWRLVVDSFPPPPGTACVPEAGGRGVVCAAEKHEICHPLLWTACVPEAGGRGVAAGNPHTSTTTLLV